MSAAAPAGRPRLQLWMVVLAVGALAGVAAAFLTGAFTSSGATGGSSSQPTASIVVSWAIIAMGLAYVGLLAYNRVAQGSMPVPTRLAITILMTIFLLIGFVVLGRVLGGGGSLPLGPVSTGQNGTSPELNASTNATQGGNVTGGGSIGLFGFAFPTWSLYVIFAVMAGLVAIAATRLVLARRSERPYQDERGAVREAFRSAALALDQEGMEPREVLIALYGELLRRIEPMAGDLAAVTAEEIRSRYLVRLGVRPKSAEEITRLFELARYSTHPISPDDTARARRALVAAIADLSHREDGA